MHGDLRQFRNPLNVSESDAGESAKLLLDRNHALLEPDGGDWVSVAIYGRNADRNDRFPLGFGQLLIIERDNNNSHTPTPTPEHQKKAFDPVSRSLHAVSLLIVETR